MPKSNPPSYGAIKYLGDEEIQIPKKSQPVSAGRHPALLSAAALAIIGAFAFVAGQGSTARGIRQKPIVSEASETVVSVRGEPEMIDLREKTLPNFISLAMAELPGYPGSSSESKQTESLPTRLKELIDKYMSPECQKTEAQEPSFLNNARANMMSREAHLGGSDCDESTDLKSCFLDFDNEPSGQKLVNLCQSVPDTGLIFTSSIGQCDFKKGFLKSTNNTILHVPICYPTACGVNNVAQVTGGTIDIIGKHINMSGFESCTFEYKITDANGTVLMERGGADFN